MEIYLATGNEHKKSEMSQICNGYKIVIPRDVGIDFSPEETGLTFIENSLIKAKALWDIVKKPVLADDSGICVEALNGVPGIYSARYAGVSNPKGLDKSSDKITQNERNALLLDHVKSVLSDDTSLNRNCHYVCAMVLYFGEDRFYCIQDTLEGTLVESIDEACGKGGFGYDPIVYLRGTKKTIADLSESEKNTVSHRGKASRKILTLLQTLEG